MTTPTPRARHQPALLRPRRRLVFSAAVSLLGGPAVYAAGEAGPAPGVLPLLQPGDMLELRVAVPAVLHSMAGAVRVARMTAAIPQRFDARRGAPVLVVSATSDAGHASSRRLLEVYRGAAVAAGWLALAVDPDEPVEPGLDTLSMRFALVRTALGALRPRWPGGAAPPLGLAGFSGGAKYAGRLASLFALQRDRLAGLFLGGINEEVVADSARRLGVLDDDFRAVPIALQAGRDDEVAPPERHRAALAALSEAGFRSVRLDLIDGAHVPSAAMLPEALAWFEAQWRERHGHDLIEAS